VTREEFLELYGQGPEAVFEVIQRLEARIKALEDRLAQNSHNSSKPPSSDGYQKPSPKSLRKPSDKEPGGQEGHPGHTLQKVQNPHHTEVHPVQECEVCHRDLRDRPASGCQTRQVFDLPPLEMEVTEHQAETKTCPHCGHVNTAAFPKGVDQPVQYGPRIQATSVYLSQYQLLPYERIHEFYRDMFGHSVSPGTLFRFNQTCFESLKFVEAAIKEAVAKAPVAHFDETGFRIEGKRKWLHLASTRTLTYYCPHPKRGQAAMEDIGILPRFQGRAIHDHWAAYFAYACAHGLCNAHHLRELAYIVERFGQPWAQEMIDLLVDTHRKVEETREFALELPPEDLRRIEQSYSEIIQRGWEANPALPPSALTPKRGRKKQSKPQNLLQRLSKYREETLVFMHDFSVPFDNNQGERDGRMMKVQQKISGCFRSEDGAKYFCRIRGYLSTLGKQGLNVLDALKSVFVGRPMMPALDTS
jgi:transposase